MARRNRETGNGRENCHKALDSGLRRKPEAWSLARRGSRTPQTHDSKPHPSPTEERADYSNQHGDLNTDQPHELAGDFLIEPVHPGFQTLRSGFESGESAAKSFDFET